MATHTRSIQILDPCPEDLPEVKIRSAALSTLEGKVVGLLENRKRHADTFLRELQDILKQAYGVRQVVYATKFSYSAPCATETIDTLVTGCDAIIHGIADWGSCTAWGLHDTVLTETRGIPSVSVLTSAFTRAAHARATALGMPEVRLAILPSPLASRSVADVQALAHAYAPEIVGLLSDR